MIQNEEKIQSVETDSEMTQMIEIVDKGIEKNIVMCHIMTFWSKMEGKYNDDTPYSLGVQQTIHLDLCKYIVEQHFYSTERKNCQLRILYPAKIFFKNKGTVLLHV